ncbi:hypothetical protein D3C80_1712390 [compost metagenome]
MAYRRQEIAPTTAAQMIIAIQRGQMAAERIARQRLRREYFEDAQFTGGFFNKLLDAQIALLMMLQHPHHLLQAAFTQPLLHAFHPLRRIHHL